MSASATYSGAPSKAAVRLTSATLIVALIVLLAYRMTLGVDLGDEGYYIAFVDGWLKTGLAGGHALGVHQTAALLVYPFVKIFVLLRGNVEGLALFLRAIYLSGSLVAALCFFRFVRELRGTAVSLLSGVLILCFIPFGLPSPSYNTIGMLAMIAALSCCGVLYLKDAHAPYDSLRLWPWAAASGCAWTVAVIAYPTLLAVQFVLLLCLLWAPPNRSRNEVWRYAFICTAIHALGACALLGIYGMDRLLEMLNFSNSSLQVSSGLGAKINQLASPMSQHPSFAVLCACAAILGICGIWLRRSAAGCFVLSLLVVAMMALSNAFGPALFAQSHDYVLLLAIFGAVLGIFSSWSGDEARHARLVRVFASVGLFAGLITSATATNGLVNFAIGGFFLAAFGLALAMPSRDLRSTLAHGVMLTAVAGLLLWTAFAFVYGEGRSPLQSELRRVRSGVFAGLLTRPKNAEAIAGTSKLLEEIAAPAESIAVFGRLPGIYLLTAMKPMALSTWDFSQQSGPLPAIEKLRSAFYATPAHQPDVVLLVNDPWTKPPSDASLQLLAAYAICRTARFEAWTVELYLKRAATPPPACGG